MFFKRQLPVYIMVTVGILTLLGHFIQGGEIENFIQKDSLSWFNIIASFSILLGAFNLLKIHFQKFFKKQKDWQYSLIALIGFTIMIIGGFFFRGANYLKIEINKSNIEVLAPSLDDDSYVLNGTLIGDIDEYFQNNLVSVCDNPKYSNSLSCYDNEGVWQAKLIDPSEFSSLTYNEENEMMDEYLSSELTWMIYDYLSEDLKKKNYDNIKSSKISIYDLKNALNENLLGDKKDISILITNDCFVLNNEEGVQFFKRSGYCDVKPKNELNITLQDFPDWRFFENFNDNNNNNKIDIAEKYVDSNNNGKYDKGEDFVDVGNGILDEGEKFYDCGVDFNGAYVCNSYDPFIDLNKNRIWDEKEPYTDLNRDGKWSEAADLWIYWLLPYSNGKWDSAEKFTDIGNGYWDAGEEYVDSNNNGKYDEGELFVDLGDGICDETEEFVDANDNGKWDSGEFFIDEGDGLWNDDERLKGFSAFNFFFKKNLKEVGSGEYLSDYYSKIDSDGIIISKEFNRKTFSSSNLNSQIAPLNDRINDFISVQIVDWGDHVTESGTFFKWLFDSAYSPIDMTMFALLAFFVASASYRAFRIRNFEASLLLLAGVLVMLGAVPIGNLISSSMFAYLFLFIIFAFLAPMIKNKKFLYIGFGISAAILLIVILIFDISGLNAKSIKAWIIDYPTIAGKKAIMIGIALGIVATSLRIIFGRDKSFLGD